MVVVKHGLVVDIERLGLGLLRLVVGRVSEEIYGVVVFAWIVAWLVHLLIINSK